MKYKDIKSVTLLGIGGVSSYYIVKFLHLLGVQIKGFDINQSERTKEFESVGIEIEYRNPKVGEKFCTDLILYSHGLKKELLESIKESNDEQKVYEVGKFYRNISKDFEGGSMDKDEVNVFKKLDLAPLFSIDGRKMRYVAVTGTDGKTTTCTMIYHLLKSAGYKPALISTVAAYIGDEKIDTGLHTTTPPAHEIFKLLKKIESENCTHVVLETTSQGLEQGRLAGLKFDVVGYTNVASEHLDYHGNWENYLNAKQLLITDNLKKEGSVVLNMDDVSYEPLRESSSNHRISTYSIEKSADFFAKDIKEEGERILFSLDVDGKGYDVVLPMLGRYNASNLLCAFAICRYEGLAIEDMIKNILSFSTIEGRMEILQREPFFVIVDFAHTPNSFEHIFSSVRPLLGKGKRLIHVFGTAGERDVYKRPIMGKLSNEFADISILTAEDPRTENLRDINNQIEEGWRDGKNKNAKLYRFDYTDKDVKVRRDAITKALELANDGDIVIITGKSHEQSLCFGQIEYPWNDIEETKKLLKRD